MLERTQTVTFWSTEVPAAAVGHGAPGGSDPVHRCPGPGPLAEPGPAAEQRPGGTAPLSDARNVSSLSRFDVVSLSALSQTGRSEEDVVVKNQTVPSAQTLARPIRTDRNRQLRRVSGGVQQ